MKAVIADLYGAPAQLRRHARRAAELGHHQAGEHGVRAAHAEQTQQPCRPGPEQLRPILADCANHAIAIVLVNDLHRLCGLFVHTHAQLVAGGTWVTTGPCDR